jgi:hypothetical protein
LPVRRWFHARCTSPGERRCRAACLNVRRKKSDFRLVRISTRHHACPVPGLGSAAPLPFPDPRTGDSSSEAVVRHWLSPFRPYRRTSHAQGRPQLTRALPHSLVSVSDSKPAFSFQLSAFSYQLVGVQTRESRRSSTTHCERRVTRESKSCEPVSL